MSNGVEAWFIDKDDDTVFHIGVPTLEGQPLTYTQSIGFGNCSSTIGTLSFVDDLPADFYAGNSGSISRFPDRLTLFIEESTPSRVSLPPVGNVRLDADQTYISRYDFINTETLGVSSGLSSQTFPLSTIDIPTLGTPIITVSGEPWIVVTSLSSASSTDKKVQYNPVIGVVTFGDDVHGAIPPTGAILVIKITIRNGGGQWKFIGINQSYDPGYNIGTVKSVRDKVYYSKTKIIAADISKITDVTSFLNFFHNDPTQAPFSGANEVTYSVCLGGSATATGGESSGFNTGFTDFFTSPSSPRPHGRGKFIPDTGDEYPSMSMTADNICAELASGVCGIIRFNPTILRNDLFDNSSMTGGAKLNIATSLSVQMSVYPIAWVRERVSISPLGQYKLDWRVFSAGSPLDVANASPILTARDTRLIRIGDQVGSFDDPLPDTFTSEDGLTSFTRSSFSKTINGVSGSHPEWMTMVWETRSRFFNKQYEDYLRFTVPSFTTIWAVAGASEVT
jgi:hypothetical protein